MWVLSCPASPPAVLFPSSLCTRVPDCTIVNILAARGIFVLVNLSRFYCRYDQHAQVETPTCGYPVSISFSTHYSEGWTFEFAATECFVNYDVNRRVAGSETMQAPSLLSPELLSPLESHVLPLLGPMDLGRLSCTCSALCGYLAKINPTVWLHAARDYLSATYPCYHAENANQLPLQQLMRLCVAMSGARSCMAQYQRWYTWQG